MCTKNARMACARACARFLDWCNDRDLTLQQIEPVVAAAYAEQINEKTATASVKQHLAAIRNLFDWLTTRHVLGTNCSRSVRGPKVSVVEGSAAAFIPRQARRLLASIDTTTIAGLRDHAITSTLIYTAAHAGAVVSLKVKHFAEDGTQWCLRFGEKGGKARKIPCPHNLEQYLHDYLAPAQIAFEKGTPLFRTVNRHSQITEKGIHRIEVNAMLKRRLNATRLLGNLSCHSFRATTVTGHLGQRVSLEGLRYLLWHAAPRATRLYDRRKKEVTRNIVERISA